MATDLSKLTREELIERRNLLQRKLALEGVLKQSGQTSFTESEEPAFGAQQIIPQSPVNPLTRAKLGFASPEGRRQILENKFGQVLGPTGREFVETDKGFQAIDPKGFKVRDIPGDIAEGLVRAPGFIGQVAGSVGGGFLGSKIGKPLLGAAIGSAGGTAAGEIPVRIVGKMLGLRPENKVSKEIIAGLNEGAKSGFLELAFGGVAKAIPGFGKLVGGVSKGVADFFRRAGGIKKSTVAWLKDRIPKVGGKVVFSEAKTNPEYAARELLPRVQGGISKLLNKFTPNTERLLKLTNATDDTIKILKNKGLKVIKETQQRLGDSTATISGRLQTFLRDNLKSAGDQFDEVLISKPKGTIQSKNFVNTIRRILKENGVLNELNQPRQGIDPRNIPRPLKKLMDILNELAPTSVDDVTSVVGAGKTRVTGEIPVADYFRFRGALDDAVTGNARNDRFLFNANSALVKDATESIPGLKEVNKIFSKAKTLSDDFGAENVTGEKALERFNKMTAKQKAKLSQLDDTIPFIDDLEQLNAARDIDNVVDKNFSTQKIETLFSQGSSETKVAGKDILQEIDDFLLDEDKFLNDFKDWLAVTDFEDAGVFNSPGGMTRTLLETGQREFFKRGLPITSKISQGVQNVTRPTGKILGALAEPKFGQFKARTGPLFTRQAIRDQ